MEYFKSFLSLNYVRFATLYRMSREVWLLLFIAAVRRNSEREYSGLLYSAC